MGRAMSPLVTQALDLVFYGMGTVFVFLTVLVAMTMLMSLLVGAPKEGVDIGNTLYGKEGADSLDPKLVAVITAAVKRHRHSKQ